MDAKTLADALDMASGSLLNLEYLPILTCFAFEGESFHAYDDRCATVVSLDTGLNCGIRGDKLIELIKTYRGDITLSATDDEVTVKRKGSTIRLPCMPPDTFIYTAPDQRKLGGFSFPMSDAFVDALLLANESVGRDSLRPDWAGVILIIKQNSVQLYATDNMTVVAIKFPDLTPKVINGGTDARIIIPRSTIAQIGRVHSGMKTPKTRTLLVTEKYVTARFGAEEGFPDVRVVSKLIPSEEAFDFAKLVKSYTGDAGTFVPVPRNRERNEDERFAASVKRAAVLCGSMSKSHMQLRIEGNILRMDCVGEFGELADRYTLPEAPGDASIKVDPSYVQRFLDVAETFAINDQKALCFAHGDSHYLVGGRTE